MPIAPSATRPEHSRQDRNNRPDRIQGSQRQDGPRQRYRDYEDDAGESVVGFGDHLPAFLRHAPRKLA